MPISSAFSSCSTTFSGLILLPLIYWSSLTRLFPFLNTSLWKIEFFPRPKALLFISASSWAPPRSRCLFYSKLYPVLTYSSPAWFPFFSATSVSKLEHLYRAASLTIASYLSSSSISLILSEAPLLPYELPWTHIDLSSYELFFRFASSFSILELTRCKAKPTLSRFS